MSSLNARLIEKDISVDLVSTEAGSSEIVDLNGATKFSCQARYTVSAFTPVDFEDDTDVNVADSEITVAAHGFPTGLKVQLTTDGTLPAPLLTATDYFVIALDANTVQLAASLEDALEGTFIELEDEGSAGGVGTITAVALAGASVLFQKSNSEDGPWINIQSATAISATGSVLLEQPDVSYRYFKAVKALTAGAVALECKTLVIGPAV